MPMVLPDLIIESVLREGFENARKDPSVIDDVFADLTRSYASKKYGQREIEKIKKLVQNREVSIVHAHSLKNVDMPCITIQLADDREDEGRSHIGDHIGFVQNPFSDPAELARLTKVTSFQPISYDTKTGIVRVPDAVNLSGVYINLLFVDANRVEFPILGGIDNTLGQKKFLIAPGATPSLSNGAEIKSSIDYDNYEMKGNIEKSQLILGVFSQEPLIVKYLYILVKYFVLSRKKDLEARNFLLSSYSGSDFHRNTDYNGDAIFSRFFNILGISQPSWRADKVALIDSIDVTAQVSKDRLGNEDLGLQNSTIKVTE